MTDPHTQRRYAYLHAMGIDVWVERKKPAAQFSPPDQPVSVEPSVTARPIAVDALRATEPASPRTDTAGMGWEELGATVAACTLCGLHESRSQTVFGVGNRSADWLLIGEAPGAEEDRRGEPFVGRAGQLLDNMILALGLRREDVFITNILKCRPPKNRDPRPEESQSCRPYLRRQIEMIQPKIVLALGRVAAQNLLQTNTPIGKLRGREYTCEDTNIPLIVTYHPAYLLRSPREKRKSWEDLCMAKDLIAK